MFFYYLGKVKVMEMHYLWFKNRNIFYNTWFDNTNNLLHKPNFKVLGPKFGKDMRFVSQAIQNLTKEAIATIEKQGEITLNINEKTVNLTLAEVEITSQDIEGWLVANQGGLTVALDVTITDDLRKEGNARELVNRVQNLRKESGFDVTDWKDNC